MNKACILNLLQGISLLSLLLSRLVSFPQLVFTHKEIRVVTVNPTSSLRWTGFCRHFFLICVTCLMTCANFDHRKWQCFNNNNNNSYIALYPVKIYKLAALYIINIKIRLTINNNNKQTKSTSTINAYIHQYQNNNNNNNKNNKNLPRNTTSRCIPIQPGLWRELVTLAKLKTKRHNSHRAFLDRLVSRSIRGRRRVWTDANGGRTRYWLCELLFWDVMGWMPWSD